jgi:hypothetical protein
MDSLISGAARALAVGDPIGALKRIGLREDAPALALRGTAMAQLGDLARARALLRRAARAYGPREALSRARCTVAEAEIALASRDLSWAPKSLSAAREALEERGDRVNAAHARYLEIRRLLLIGRLVEAEQAIGQLDPDVFPPPLRAAHELVIAGIAVRRVQARTARIAFARALHAARQAGIPALEAEVEAASLVLTIPAARLIAHGKERDLRLEEVESLLCSRKLVIDACRFSVREAGTAIELARRPVLFTLARLLAEAWPTDVSRETLIVRAFRAKHVDETYRARLRVEVGRLRRALRTLANVVATKQGFRILPRRAREIIVLARPLEDEHAALLALLADGESWSSSALALALGISPRTVQRGLQSLTGTGKVQALGRGRARRWMSSPMPGFATTLLLPVTLPGDLG